MVAVVAESVLVKHQLLISIDRKNPAPTYASRYSGLICAILPFLSRIKDRPHHRALTWLSAAARCRASAAIPSNQIGRDIGWMHPADATARRNRSRKG
jgi:hypothetical protein